ncbi:MAG: hypothetical protein VKI82_01470 [Leptolyngbya sp.]|nr:hypothetical protein [Leptolyngbya sp.]
MATARWVLGGLAVGILLLLGLQNWSPRLPLIFLGSRTLALPLGIWLVLAIILGGLTTLALHALLEFPPRRQGKGHRYRYEPQPFYEPAKPDASPEPDFRASDRYDAPRDRASSPVAEAADGDSTWQDWTNLQSPSQWDSWSPRRPAPRRTEAPPPPASGPGRSSPGWFSRRQATEPDPRVQDSLREITDDWDDVDPRRYRPSGVSPVEESLAEITEGWDDLEPPSSPEPSAGSAARTASRDDGGNPPTQVYRNGSIYAYGYGDQGESGQTDRIYAPPDDDYGDGYGEAYGDGYGDEDVDVEAKAADPEEGVVDADFRVIIPPAPMDPTQENG